MGKYNTEPKTRTKEAGFRGKRHHFDCQYCFFPQDFPSTVPFATFAS